MQTIAQRLYNLVKLIERRRPPVDQYDGHSVWVRGRFMYKVDREAINGSVIMVPSIHFIASYLPVVTFEPLFDHGLHCPSWCSVFPPDVLFKLIRILCFAQLVFQELELLRSESGDCERFEIHVCRRGREKKGKKKAISKPKPIKFFFSLSRFCSGVLRTFLRVSVGHVKLIRDLHKWETLCKTYIHQHFTL